MASVVFLRGVNVGGHKVFRPSDLARQLAALRVVNIGAAGTFVVRAGASEAKIRTEFGKRVPFDAHLMIRPASDLIELVERQPFAGEFAEKADGQFICILEESLKTRPRLPLYVPDARNWQVGLTAIHGPFVVALWRRSPQRVVYPNEVVEKNLGVAGTTRNWKTILKVHDALTKDVERASR